MQYPWEQTPRRFHEHRMEITPFYIDKYPVTNAQFKQFLDASHYAPQDPLNFLKDWKDGSYPPGWANKPVTWVSIEDARAYAHWAGKRLPHEWEWQRAAQGDDGRTYPWGNTWDPKAVPLSDQGRALRGPDDVDAHPSGASPLGVMDMVGNVWEWTLDWFGAYTTDCVNCADLTSGSSRVLRGGSFLAPTLLVLASDRNPVAPLQRANDYGVRCARTP